MALRLIDLEGNHYPAEASTGMDEELNSDSMLSISFQSTKINNFFISDLSELWKISRVKGPSDDTEYVVNFLTRKGIGEKMVVHVRAIPKMFDDLAKEREYERFDQSFTAHNFFTLVFKDTPYTFVLLDSFGALRFEGLGEGDQKIEMFIHGINRYGIEFEIVGKEVRMRKRVERDMPYQLRWRLNASNIQEEIDATGFVTYAKGYGDYGDGEGGEDWQEAKLVREYTSPLAQIPGIGIRHAQPIKNGNITDVNTMDDNLKNLVDESLKVSVTADFHRLKNYPYAEPQKGDLIHLIDERINFKRKVRVIKVVTYRDSKGNIKKQDVTFGDVGITKRHQAKINNSINTVDRIMEGRQKIPFSVLDDAVLAATKALQNAQTELMFPESGGIHAVDKTNPNKMVVYNSAGLGISDDGGQTFKTAITGDGIVADVITAGTIRGIDIIGTNIISYSNDNNDVITMNDGEIETFVSGVKRFGIYGQGLKAFSWITGEEVASFRSTNLNGSHGAGIMGSGEYFNIGKIDPANNSDDTYLFFDFEEENISAWVNRFVINAATEIDGSLQVIGESDLYGILDMHNWDILNVGDIDTFNTNIRNDIHFTYDRGWKFIELGSGASSSLGLHALHGLKSFKVADPEYYTVLDVRVGNNGNDGRVEVYGDFHVSGSKNALVQTENYGKRLMYADESTGSFFNTRIHMRNLAAGKHSINIDKMFLETVSDYLVLPFVRNGSEVHILKENETSFDVEVIEKEADVLFYITGTRKGFEGVYMEEFSDEVESETPMMAKSTMNKHSNKALVKPVKNTFKDAASIENESRVLNGPEKN